jgi:hypothetical protein
MSVTGYTVEQLKAGTVRAAAADFLFVGARLREARFCENVGGNHDKFIGTLLLEAPATAGGWRTMLGLTVYGPRRPLRSMAMTWASTSDGLCADWLASAARRVFPGMAANPLMQTGAGWRLIAKPGTDFLDCANRLDEELALYRWNKTHRKEYVSVSAGQDSVSGFLEAMESRFYLHGNSKWSLPAGHGGTQAAVASTLTGTAAAAKTAKTAKTAKMFVEAIHRPLVRLTPKPPPIDSVCNPFSTPRRRIHITTPQP